MGILGVERRAKKWVNLERDLEGRTETFRKVKESISMLPEANQKIVWKYIEVDYLTGAFNLDKLMRYGEEMKEILNDHDISNLCFLMIDIDDFKKYNDTFGHERGNEVLREVTETIFLDLRIYDNVFRYGGEELVVTLPGDTLSQGVNVATRIKNHIRNRDFYRRDVTVSVGVANQSEMPLNVRNLISMADVAMYVAKARGKNQVVAYDNDTEKEFLQTRQTE